MARIIRWLGRINDGVALLAGFGLLACVVLILAEIVARRFGAPLGGTDEISGYVMAGVTSWGISYALTERAHVRIDLLRVQGGPRFRAGMDCLAMLSMAGVALITAWHGWGVLDKTLGTGARANTALETPLWIPQAIWWAGWSWFAFSAVVLSIGAVVLMLKGRFDSVETIVGTETAT
ncbi:TRAP transporter small permease subunit [Limimaricola hongkongensis]|uniref:TRAP transporter small permease protein n=1 Tax=Limimaricola hongkongensis DSM 17492 TaxID=1122180 RepID=A0A017HD29_9RHOB|nr:TRAP transporter small permease [Limimaricola hongkongensis]EYD72215.1 TRAP dicarboxylate transporter, DctQ subunit, unknown substrate 7 [Limimaricola hongkongensis DSM 17492]